MPLPDKVIEQLGREPPKTPGWSFGIVMFSGTILFIVVFVYFGLTLGYEPYLNSQVTKQQDQINQLGQSISPADQGNLINFYSQISNLKTLLKNHTLTSKLFAWLEKNTEANVTYQSLSFAQGNQITLAGTAISEGDINQQIAIFESSPEISKVNLTSVASGQSGNSGWAFALTLTVSPSIILP